jgi:hypothetical protein
MFAQLVQKTPRRVGSVAHVSCSRRGNHREFIAVLQAEKVRYEFLRCVRLKPIKPAKVVAPALLGDRRQK